jgi:hypothetical protein
VADLCDEEPGTPDRLTELLQPIGRFCTLPDGSRARIMAVAVTGTLHRIEYLVTWWYQAQRHEIWLEPCELELPGKVRAPGVQ